MKAYITLFSTNDYIYGLIGLMYSWKRTNSKYPFYVIVTPDITQYNKQILAAIGYNIIEREKFVPERYSHDLEVAPNDVSFIGHSDKDITKSSWYHTWTKLDIFGLTQFEKLVYIDADSMILHNIDDLFDRPAWSAPQEALSWFREKPSFNSGMMVVEPSAELYDKLITFANQHHYDDRLTSDQDVLNDFMPDWGKHYELSLPFNYHVNWCIFNLEQANLYREYAYNNIFNMKAIHFMEKKPWDIGRQTYGGNWEFYDFLLHYYVDFLNSCLRDMFNRDIAVLPLIK